MNRFYSLSEFHSILTPAEWKFTTQLVESRPVHSIFTPKEVITDVTTQGVKIEWNSLYCFREYKKSNKLWYLFLFFDQEDANVIVVDWPIGADQRYSKSAQNARVVGRGMALLAQFLNLEEGMYYRDVHLVGMSLGGQVVGYAGEFQPGFGRITGMHCCV